MTLYYFEDTLLASLEAVDLSRLLEVIEQLAPDTEPLFSDKIRILPSWEYIFRALHDGDVPESVKSDGWLEIC